MGAVVVHGSGFTRERLEKDGVEYIYLRPRNGGSFEMSYSALKALQDYCERFGVSAEDWPKYVDLGGYNIPEEEMMQQNRRLAAQLSDLGPEATKGIQWLESVVEVLRTGQYFYIH